MATLNPKPTDTVPATLPQNLITKIPEHPWTAFAAQTQTAALRKALQARMVFLNPGIFSVYRISELFVHDWSVTHAKEKCASTYGQRIAENTHAPFWLNWQNSKVPKQALRTENYWTCGQCWRDRILMPGSPTDGIQASRIHTESAGQARPGPNPMDQALAATQFAEISRVLQILFKPQLYLRPCDAAIKKAPHA